MSDKYISMKNLRFLLYDVHNIQDLIEHSYYQDHDRETFDLVLDTAEKIGTDLLYPYHDEMDKNPPEFSDGRPGQRPARSVHDGSWAPPSSLQCGERWSWKPCAPISAAPVSTPRCVSMEAGST